MRFSKLIVTAVVALNAIFAAAVFYVFLRVGNEPGVLVAAWFAFTTGELMALAAIRNKEVGKEGNKVEPEEANPNKQ